MTDKNSGRVTFMPLNRLHPKSVTYPQDDSLYQTMLSVLEYDPMYEKAFQQVFGKAIICPNIEVASQFARTDNINAVTLDGKIVINYYYYYYYYYYFIIIFIYIHFIFYNL